jgi:NADH-ubiquinone oxidoreductase chain 4
MLALLVLIPVLGSLLLIPINENSPESLNKIKIIALTTSLINFLISLKLWLNFDSSCTTFQFVYEFNQLSFCDFNIGVDGISLFFVLLTTFITPIAILSNYKNINKNLKYYFISFLLLETLQILTFVALDLLLFYIFFESVLPILFIIIIVYGSGENKDRSALLLFLYTLFGSLPMLLSILTIQSIVGSTDYLLLSLIDINLDTQKLLWLGFFIAFAIKTPLWPLSRWLALAHSDSPLAGSIILAGTILKLASYGMIRILLTYFPDATHFFSPIVQSIAVITIIFASLATIIQQDTKRLIAYSSITHMAVGILGIFSNSIIGIEGAFLLSISHGCVSAGLFICLGGIVYDRTNTRLIKYLKGLVLYMPLFTILFFVFCLANMATPLTLNFVAEQMSLLGIWSINPIIAILGGTGIVLSACFTILLYNRISYGEFSKHLKPMKDISRIEFISLITLLITVLILGILPNVILGQLHVAVTSLLYSITPETDLFWKLDVVLNKLFFALHPHSTYSDYKEGRAKVKEARREGEKVYIKWKVKIKKLCKCGRELYVILLNYFLYVGKVILRFAIIIALLNYSILDLNSIFRKPLTILRIFKTIFCKLISFLVNCWDSIPTIVILNKLPYKGSFIYYIFIIFGLIGSLIIRLFPLSIRDFILDINFLVILVLLSTSYLGFVIFNYTIKIQNAYKLRSVFKSLLKLSDSELYQKYSISHSNLFIKYILFYLYILFISAITFFIIYTTYISIVNVLLFNVSLFDGNNSFLINYFIYFFIFILILSFLLAILFLIKNKKKVKYDFNIRINSRFKFAIFAFIGTRLGVDFLALWELGLVSRIGYTFSCFGWFGLIFPKFSILASDPTFLIDYDLLAMVDLPVSQSTGNHNSNPLPRTAKCLNLAKYFEVQDQPNPLLARAHQPQNNGTKFYIKE